MSKADDKLKPQPIELEDTINHALDQSIETLSPEIRRSLNQSRFNATEKKSRRVIWIPLASAMSLAFALIIGWQISQPPATSETVFADVLQEDLEMLEDLEFAYWISEEIDSAKL
jgi:hypothetical protein